MPHYIDGQLPEFQNAPAAATNHSPGLLTTKNVRRKSSTTFPSRGDRRKFSFDADDEMSPEFCRGRGDERAGTHLSPASEYFQDRLTRTGGKVTLGDIPRQDFDRDDFDDYTMEPRTLHSSPASEQIALGSPFRKRRMSSSDSISAQPRKKVRFNPNPATPPRPATYESRSQLAVFESYCGVLAQLQHHPRALPLTVISGCFRTLQKRTEIFSRQWFGDSEDFIDNVPLHELQEKYPALFYTIQYVLDASSTTGKENQGWRKFFKDPELRSYLVYAILGEWFVQNIFKHTAFGVSYSAQQQISEEVDKTYLHHDAIVRSKARSELLKQYWSCENPKMVQDCLSAATFALADDLSMVLEPLMTPRTLGSLELFTADLKGLILNCAGLHLSMLITGGNGTVFMYPGGVTNGTVFHPGHNHFACVNLSPAQQTKHYTNPSELLLVKMTCWARIEAYVPHGADMTEMSEMEDALVRRTKIVKEERLGRRLTEKEVTKIEDNFDWADTDEGRNFWQPLPRELWADAQAKIEKQDMMAKSAAIKKIIERKRRMKASTRTRRSSTLSDTDSELDFTEPSIMDEESDVEEDEDEVMRGPYTTIYHCICPHVVYCEWTSKELTANADTARPAKKGTNSKSLRQINTLAAAVAQARSELRGYAFHKASFEDLSRRIWNSYARNSLYIEWGVFLFAVLSSLTFSLSRKQGPLHDLLKISASSVAFAADTAKELLKTGSNLLVDPAKLSETLDRALQSNSNFQEKFIKAFAQAFSNISPGSFVTTATRRLTMAPGSRLTLDRDTATHSLTKLGLGVFGGLSGVFGRTGPTVAQSGRRDPAFPIVTREATVGKRTMY